MTVNETFTKKRKDFRHLIEITREDYYAHDRDWTTPGFHALAVHRFGIWVKTMGRPWLLHALLKFIHWLLYTFVRNYCTIELQPTAKVGRRLRIGHQGGIVIHSQSEIGDDCVILQNVTLGAATEETIKRAPILGNRVQIGCGAALIGGVVIGDDVRIGPNAVVTMNIPPGSTVVAPPPRVIQVRRPLSPPSASPTVQHNEQIVR